MISFFAKRAFTAGSHGKPFEPGDPRTSHLLRVSSMIRADQIAERLGARLNPESDYDGDTCIYVKPHVKPGEPFAFRGRRAWLDIIDGWGLTPLAQAHPGVGVIACSDFDGQTLRKLLPNRVTVIPQHHCNFERLSRERDGVKTVGMIGTAGAWRYLPAEIKTGLARRGLRLEFFTRFYERQDIIDFYQRIDVQVVWRPYRMRLANPLKLVNAASFGVPTIARREDYFCEMDGAYLPVGSVEEFFARLDELRSWPLLYDQWAARARAKSERYHIDNVAALYRSLDD